MEKEINVVVLDDEENIRESVKRLFFRESFAVTSTGTPKKPSVLSRSIRSR